MNIRTFIKKERTLIAMVVGMTILLAVTPLLQNGKAQEIGDGLNEDQALYCIKDTWTEDFTKQGNEKVACMLIDDLDLLTDAQEQYIYGRFMAELDTFNFSDASGIID